MHDDHGHHGHHHHGHHHHGHGHGHDHGHGHGRPGHNGGRGPLQWQTPHLPPGHEPAPSPAVRDLDLVEKAFVDGFAGAPDVPSFLRLAGIAFVGVDGRNRRLHLLRVEVQDCADVGSITPLLGGDGVRYDPLPEKLSSRRKSLAFVYHDGNGLVRLGFGEARALVDVSEASRFDIARETPVSGPPS